MQKINALALRIMIILIGGTVLLLCLSALPNMAQEMAHIHPEVAYLQYPILLGMYATAIPFFYALYETLKIIGIVERESIFSNRIAEGLNYIKYCAYIIIALYVAGFFLLDYANALPPLAAVAGVVIIAVTSLIAAGAAFMKHALVENRRAVNASDT